MLKNSFMLFLLFIFVFCVFNPASAVENELAYEPDIAPRWTLIQNINNSLSINSNGLAQMSSFIYAYPMVDSVRISTHLQRQESGAWVTVRNWTRDYDGNSGFWSGTWYVTSGYNYRLLTFYYAYADGSQDSASLISPTQYY